MASVRLPPRVRPTGHAPAVAGALYVTVCVVTGITNRSLRALMTGLLGSG
jgi:hypothetical protein